ncbi:uncharacterized protein LOC129955378 isoform X2 [Argiope bruennichi]|uniref:uncharacterized protein LOC129955378 isoform X2 n=1 Tax=Argiope bruennichi TaxID=94029 RepID=UPI00249402AD|nr:uncharacterized protein LOC129955378 isoform X2 [Argiope bruennichi]
MRTRMTRRMKIIKFDSKISWAVALACGCMNLLILIPMKVGGLIFVEILDRYHVGRNLAGYPTFTITLMRSTTGPLVGYFAERFGMNGVMILGSILSAAGISACFFAEDIAVVIVLLGVLHGLGVAFLNTFLPMIVKIYFKKHLTLAFGVTQAGACIGAVFTPPLLLWIFRNYGTSGGFLIIGAMVLNSLPIVMIINILSPDRTSSKSVKSKECTKEQLETGATTTVHFLDGEDNALTYITGGKEEKVVKVSEKNIISKIQNSPESEDVASLVLNSPECDHAEVATDGTDAKVLGPLSHFNMCKISAENADSETGKKGIELLLDKFVKASEIKQQKQNHKEEIKITASKTIIQFQNYFEEEFIPCVDIKTKSIDKDCEENVQQSNDYTYSKKRFKYKAEVSNKDTQEQTLKSANDRDRVKDSNIHTPPCNFVNNISCGSLTFPTKTQLQPVTETEEITFPVLNIFNSKSLESMLPCNQQFHQREVLQIDEQRSTRATNANKSLKIFLDVTFWIVIITHSLHLFVFVMFWTTMIDFSRDKNVDRSMEVYLLMVLPIAEIAGRLGLGWVTDCNYLTKINFCVVFFTLMGCSCSLMAWAHDIYTVMGGILVFGVSSSGLISVFPMVIFAFFDTANHTMGQASSFCLFGPLSFLNGPMIGYFRDTVGSYSWLYHTLAVVSVACGALSALIPVLARIRDEKRKKKRTS